MCFPQSWTITEPLINKNQSVARQGNRHRELQALVSTATGKKVNKKNASRKPVPEMNARDDGTKRKQIQSIQKRHRWRWLMKAKLESGKPQVKQYLLLLLLLLLLTRRNKSRVEKAN
jgi:hypothetical protein